MAHRPITRSAGRKASSSSSSSTSPSSPVHANALVSPRQSKRHSVSLVSNPTLPAFDSVPTLSELTASVEAQPTLAVASSSTSSLLSASSTLSPSGSRERTLSFASLPSSSSSSSSSIDPTPTASSSSSSQRVVRRKRSTNRRSRAHALEERKRLQQIIDPVNTRLDRIYSSLSRSQKELFEKDREQQERLRSLREQMWLERAALYAQRAEFTRQIAGFWLQAMLGDPTMAMLLERPTDRELLGFLRDISIHRDRYQVRFRFEFAENPFMQNQILERVFSRDLHNHRHCVRATIRWKLGRCLTLVAPKRLYDNRGRVVPPHRTDSFFSWFEVCDGSGTHEIARHLEKFYHDPLSYFFAATSLAPDSFVDRYREQFFRPTLDLSPILLSSDEDEQDDDQDDDQDEEENQSAVLASEEGFEISSSEDDEDLFNDVSSRCSATTTGSRKRRRNIEHPSSQSVAQLARETKGAIIGRLVDPSLITQELEDGDEGKDVDSSDSDSSTNDSSGSE